MDRPILGHAHSFSFEMIRDAVVPVARASGYRLVVLFGSAARGEPAGDVDLGVLASTPLDVVDAINRFTQALGTSAVDVADLRLANPVMLMAVARDGLPVFDDTGTAFNEFSSLAMRRYADTKKFRDAVRDDLRDYAAHGRTDRT